MRLNTGALVETGAGLVINYGVTSQVGDNLRWNGNPTRPEDDTVYRDRRLWAGLIGVAAEQLGDGMISQAGGVVAQGALGSLVTTETLRMRLQKPATPPAPAPGAPAQLPGGAASSPPPVQTQGDLYAGFYGWQSR